MCGDSVLSRNLIAMCCIWAVSGFNFYMLDFYVKYFPGNVFFNKSFLSVCDALAIFYINELERRFKAVPVVIAITLVCTVFLSVLYMAVADLRPEVLVPLLIGLVHLQINAILAYSYHVN